MSKLKLLVMIVFLTVVNAPFTVDAAGPKTYLGVSGISFDYMPFWYAKDYRLYQKYNVDVDMITTGGGTVLAQAMLSGGVHFAAIGSAFLQSSMQGADHVLLAAHINYFPYRVVGLPSIAGKEGLRGTTIAISRFGSNADTALRIALREAGLDPAKEVTIIQLGTQPSALLLSTAAEFRQPSCRRPSPVPQKKPVSRLFSTFQKCASPFRRSVWWRRAITWRKIA